MPLPILALLIAAHLVVLAGALIAGALALSGSPALGATLALLATLPAFSGLLWRPRLTLPVTMAGWSALLLPAICRPREASSAGLSRPTATTSAAARRVDPPLHTSQPRTIFPPPVPGP